MTVGRRQLLVGASATALAGCLPRFGRPDLESGVQSGDVDATTAVIWSRAHAPSQMQVEWSLSPRFSRVTRIAGPEVDAASDLCGKVQLTGLPNGQRIHYRAWFGDSEWLPGSFTTAPGPTDARDVTLAWSGDVNGQGWGIDPSRGGMPAFTALRERMPDLFLHCGDAIYADERMPPRLTLPDGTEWRNMIDPQRAPFARNLADFRASWRYARRSAEVRAASAVIPVTSIWDDHEIRNDWFPGQNVAGLRTEALIPVARHAMTEHLPTFRDAALPMYRSFSWGPLVDIFMLDDRSYRSPNFPPGQTTERAGILGAEQVAWLVDGLHRSRATWKLVVTGQPIADVVTANDGWGGTERVVELAALLERARVKNMVWLSADVHYGAARRFRPERALVPNSFEPFWELVAGPMHAATFPKNPLDDTFGPEEEWCSAGPTFSGTPANGEQFFGLVHVSGQSRALTVTFVDARGRDAHKLVIPAV